MFEVDDSQNVLDKIGEAVQAGLHPYVSTILPPDGRLIFGALPKSGVLGYMEHGAVETHYTKTRLAELNPITGTFSCALTEEALATEHLSSLSMGWIHGIAHSLTSEVVRVVENDKRMLGRISPRFNFVIWNGCKIKAERHYDTYMVEIALKLRFRTYVCGPMFEEAEVI